MINNIKTKGLSDFNQKIQITLTFCTFVQSAISQANYVVNSTNPFFFVVSRNVIFSSNNLKFLHGNKFQYICIGIANHESHNEYSFISNDWFDCILAAVK